MMREDAPTLDPIPHDARANGSTFVCHECGAADTFVKDTRRTRFGGYRVVRRRRICDACKARFTTIEIQVGDMERLTGEDPMVAKALVHRLEQAILALSAIYRRNTGQD
jgi:transcriptional regulator NrdR family protein